MLRRYENLDPGHRPHGMGAIVRWGFVDRILGRRRVRAPGPPAPAVVPDLGLVRSAGPGARLTWIGHASFLITIDGSPVLVDPHFSRYAGALYGRHAPPGLRWSDLPAIAGVLVTHNHYDHLDAPTMRRLRRGTPVFCPAGLGRWFRRRGFRHIREMGWWETASLGPLKVHFVPARHWSRRRVADTNRSWWGGFVLEGAGASVYHAGDTAAFDGFREIGRRFAGLDAAVLPVGAYSPGWFMEHYHLNPEQAGEAFLETGARTFVPMHWGVFQLTDEPLREPAERIRVWWDRSGPRDGRSIWVPTLGQTRSVEGS